MLTTFLVIYSSAACFAVYALARMIRTTIVEDRRLRKLENMVAQPPSVDPNQLRLPL